jgi:hypothetical protein
MPNENRALRVRRKESRFHLFRSCSGGFKPGGT